MTIDEFNKTCIKICEADQSLKAELYQIMYDWGYGYDIGTGFHPVPVKVLASAAIKAISYNYKPEILQSPFILTTECDDFLQKLLSMKHTLDPVRTETEPNLKEVFEDKCLNVCYSDKSLQESLNRRLTDHGYNLKCVPKAAIKSLAEETVTYNFLYEQVSPAIIRLASTDRDFYQGLLSRKFLYDNHQNQIKYIEMKNASVDDMMSRIRSALHEDPQPDDMNRLSPIRMTSTTATGQTLRNMQMPFKHYKYQHPVNYDNKENTNMEKFIKVNAKKIEDATNTWIDGYIVCKNSERFYPGDIYCYTNTVDTIPASYMQYISAEPMSINLLVYGSVEGLVSKMPASYLKDFSNLAIYKVSAYVNRSIAAQIQNKILTTCGTSDFVVEECICDNFAINELINENNDLLHVFEYFTFGNAELTPDVEKIVSKLSVNINGIHSFVSDILLMKPSIRKWMKRANCILYTRYNSSHDVLNCLLDVENLIDRSINIINMMVDNGCTPSEIVTTFMNYKL